MRLEGDYTLCLRHDRQAHPIERISEPHPIYVAHEILPPNLALDSAQAVNAALTRVFRCVVQERLSARHAAVLGYLGQLIISTLPGMQREAEARPAHNLLGRDPDAALDQLAQSLQRSLATALESTAPNGNKNANHPSPAALDALQRDKPEPN